jgi:hypothetical protein
VEEGAELEEAELESEDLGTVHDAGEGRLVVLDYEGVDVQEDVALDTAFNYVQMETEGDMETFSVVFHSANVNLVA